MASKRYGHIALAASLGICFQTQAALLLAAHAQGTPTEVPTAPAGAPEVSTPTSTVPSPLVPDLSTIITPEVSAILSLSAPSPTTMVIDFGQNPTLNFSGDFTNSNNTTLYAVSSNPNVTTATISAANIYNAGIITTILPAGGLEGYSGLVSNLSLVLNAVNNIVNIGEISSAGSLNLTAGNAVVNAGGVAAAPTAAMISATTNASLLANNIVNTGIISAMNNINIASMIASNLAINASGGTFQAGGNITIRDASFSEKQNLDILGGLWNSSALDFYSGTGITKVVFESAAGVLNGSTGELYMSSIGTLNVGNIAILGDPVFSSENDLYLGSVSANETISAFAHGSIFAGSLSANGGGISMQAQDAISVSGNLQTTHSIGMRSASISASGALHADGSVFITGTSLALNGSRISAGENIDFESQFLSANNTQMTAGGSITSLGESGGSASFNNAVIDAAANIGIGAGNIFAIESKMTAGSEIYLGADTGVISSTLSEINAHGSVTVDSLNSSVDLSGATVKSNGGSVFIYGSGSVSLGPLLDSSGTMGGRIFVASQTGSVIAPEEGLITTGNSAASPPPGYFEVSIGARDSVSLGHVRSGSGNISIQSGATIERNGGAVLAIVTQEGAGSTKVGSVNSSGAFTGRGDVEVFGAGGGIQVGKVTGNGLAVLIDSKASLALGQALNNIVDDRGGFNSIQIFANDSSPLVIKDTSVSANGVHGGGLIEIANYGEGGLHVQENGVSAAATKNGSGGTMFLTSGGSLIVDGDLVVNGKSEGSGGIVELTALGGNIEVAGKIAANGEGDGFSGGRILLRSLVGDVKVQGGSVSVNGASGDGGGFGASAFGKVSIPAVFANGGGEFGTGGNINISANSFDGSSLTLNANGSAAGGGGTIWLASESSFDATEGVSISAKGGDTGNGGNLRLSSGHDLSVASSKWNIAAGTNGHGGSVTLESGKSGQTSNLTISGMVNVDGNGTGNGGLIDIRALGIGSDFTVGSGGNANVLSAYSGKEGGNGGSITVVAGGSLTVTASALGANARGGSGDGAKFELRAGASGGGPIGTLAVSSVGSSAGAVLTISGTLNADAAKSGQGGKITASASGENASVDLQNAKLNARGGGTTGDGGSVTVNATKSIDLGATNISVSGRGSGDGGQIELSSELINFGDDNVQILADGGTSGHGGRVLFSDTGSGSEGGGGVIAAFARASAVELNETDQGRLLISARSKALDNQGGVISFEALNRDVTIGGGAVTFNANGSASTITITAKSLVLGSESKNVNILARAHSNDEHPIVTLTALDGPLTVYGNITATGRDAGKGGQISLNSTGHLSVFGDLFADGGPSGTGGTIDLKGADVTVGTASAPQNLVARGGTQGGSGGTITITGNGTVALNTSFLSASARGGDGDGGKINIVSSQNLSLGGDVTASSHGNGKGGEVTVTLRDPLTISKGHIFAVAPGTGEGGKITFVGLDPMLDITLNDKISASSEKGTNGTIYFQSPESIKLIGTGALEGKLNAASQKDTSIELGGKSSIEVESLTSAEGDVNFSSAKVGSVINLKGASVSASAGTVTLKASKIHNLEGAISAAQGVFLGHDGNFELSGSGGIVRVTPAKNQVTGDGIAITGKSLLFSGNGITLDTSDASGLAKEVRIESASNIANEGSILNIKADGNGGALVKIDAGRNVNLGDLKVSATSKDGAGSEVLITATGTVQLHGSIDASSSGSGAGGGINITGSSVAVTEGKELSLKATAVENEGGKIGLKSVKGDLNLTHISSDVSVSSQGRGGALSFQAPKGTLVLTTAPLSANGTADGDGGGITLNAERFQFSSSTFAVSAKGKNGGTVNLFGGDLQLKGAYDVSGQVNGGTINVHSQSVYLGQGLEFQAGGTTGGSIVITATSGDVKVGSVNLSVLGTQEHGDVHLYAADNVSMESALLKHDDASFQARVIEIAAGTDGSGKLTLTAPLNVIAKGSHLESRIQLGGQEIAVDAPLYAKEGSGGATIKVIASSSPSSKIVVSKGLQAEGRLNGGTVIVEASKGSIEFANTADISANGFNFAPGGEVRVSAGKSLQIPNDITAQSFSPGDKPGGQITISSSGVLTVSGKLNVSGNLGDQNSSAGKIRLTGGTKVEFFGNALVSALSGSGASSLDGHVLEVFAPKIEFQSGSRVVSSGGVIDSRVVLLKSQDNLSVIVNNSDIASSGRIVLSASGKVDFRSNELDAVTFRIDTQGNPDKVALQVQSPQSSLILKDVSGGALEIRASNVTIGRIAATSGAGSLTLTAIPGESLTVSTQGARTITANVVKFNAPGQTVSVADDLLLSSFDSSGNGNVLLNANTKTLNVGAKLTSSSLRIHSAANLTVSGPGRIEALVSLSLTSNRNLTVSTANVIAPELRLNGNVLTLSGSNFVGLSPGIHVNAQTRIVLGPNLDITAFGGPIQFQVGSVAPMAGAPPTGVSSVGQVLWGQDVVDVRPPLPQLTSTTFEVRGVSNPVSFSGPIDSIILQETVPVGGGVHIRAIAATELIPKTKVSELSFVLGPVRVWHRGAQFRFASPRNLRFEAGELIVDCSAELSVDTIYGALTVRPGTTALLKQSHRRLQVTVLAAKRSHSVVLSSNNQKCTVSYGERLEVGEAEEDATDVPFRSLRVHHIDPAKSLKIQSCEVSLPALLSQNPLLQSIRGAERGQPNELVSKVLRTAASLMLVTGHRGPYRRQ